MNLIKTLTTSTALITGLFLAGANAQEDAAGSRMAEPSIVEIAAGSDDFSTLVAALEAAGLVDVLSGEGPFTVFAPTNEAFENLPEGTVESLLQPENKDQLTAILTFHVVSGKVMAADVVTLNEAATVQGSMLQIHAMDDGVMVGNANVVTTDIEASNGVIHVIDNVLIP